MKVSMEDLTVSLKTEITYKELIAANQRMVDKLKAHVDGNIDCSIELDNLVDQYTKLNSRTQGLLSRIGRLINKESKDVVEEAIEHSDTCTCGCFIYEEETNITKRKKVIKEAIEYFNEQTDKIIEQGFTIERNFLEYNTVHIVITSSITGIRFSGVYTYNTDKVFNLHLLQAIGLSLVLKDGKHIYFKNVPEPSSYEVGQRIEFGQIPYNVRVAEISSVESVFGKILLKVDNGQIAIKPQDYPYIKILEDTNMNLE